MQTVNVHFPGMRLDEGAGKVVAPENGDPGDGGFDIDRGDAGNQRAGMVELLLEQAELIRPCNGDHAARRQQRMFAKAGRRMFEKGAAGDRQAAHQAAAIILGKAGGRAAGRMVAALTLAFQNDDRGELRRLVGRARAGNSSADD